MTTTSRPILSAATSLAVKLQGRDGFRRVMIGQRRPTSELRETYVGNSVYNRWVEPADDQSILIILAAPGFTFLHENWHGIPVYIVYD